MAKALVLLADGFEEIEAVTIVDVLRRADIAVTVAGLHEGSVRGSHDIAIQADTALGALTATDFDTIVLPGGAVGAENLKNDAHVIELLQRFVAQQRLTAAI